VRGKELRPDAKVVVHVGDDALDVVLRGFDRRVGGAEPELLVGVEAEVRAISKIRDSLELSRQALLVPAADRQIHHMAHSQRGRRSTGSKFITARKRSTWFIVPPLISGPFYSFPGSEFQRKVVRGLTARFPPAMMRVVKEGIMATRTPRQIFQHHGQVLGAGDLDGIVSDYSEDAIFITPKA